MAIADDAPVILKTDLRDLLQVFAYTNLSKLTSPHPEVIITPQFRSALEAYINFLPGGFGLPPDIQDIVNAFILTNLDEISQQRIVAGSNLDEAE